MRVDARRVDVDEGRQQERVVALDDEAAVAEEFEPLLLRGLFGDVARFAQPRWWRGVVLHLDQRLRVRVDGSGGGRRRDRGTAEVGRELLALDDGRSGRAVAAVRERARVKDAVCAGPISIRKQGSEHGKERTLGQRRQELADESERLLDLLLGALDEVLHDD